MRFYNFYFSAVPRAIYCGLKNKKSVKMAQSQNEEKMEKEEGLFWEKGDTKGCFHPEI